MSSKKKIIGVDFDEVVFDGNGSIMEFHNAKYGTSYKPDDRFDYFYEMVWQCSTEEVGERMRAYEESNFHHEAPIVLGAKEALTALKEFYDIVIVTARSENSRGITEAWINKNVPGLITEIYFVDHFSIVPSLKVRKSDICNELGVSAFVEDAIHQAKDIAASGVPVFLLDAPWNRGETPAGATRVYSWQEIVSYLLPEGVSRG